MVLSRQQIHFFVEPGAPEFRRGARWMRMAAIVLTEPALSHYSPGYKS